MEPDSGAEVNLLSEYQFRVLLQGTKQKLTLQHFQIKLNTLQHQTDWRVFHGGLFENLLQAQISSLGSCLIWSDSPYVEEITSGKLLGLTLDSQLFLLTPELNFTLA